MSDEKIEAMFTVIHEENKFIMSTLLSIVCYPKDYETTRKSALSSMDEIYEKVMKLK